VFSFPLVFPPQPCMLFPPYQQRATAISFLIRSPDNNDHVNIIYKRLGREQPNSRRQHEQKKKSHNWGHTYSGYRYSNLLCYHEALFSRFQIACQSHILRDASYTDYDTNQLAPCNIMFTWAPSNAGDNMRSGTSILLHSLTSRTYIFTDCHYWVRCHKFRIKSEGRYMTCLYTKFHIPGSNGFITVQYSYIHNSHNCYVLVVHSKQTITSIGRFSIMWY
jgi:hypothetical protein